MKMLRKTRSLIFLPGHMPKKTRAPLWRYTSSYDGEFQLV